MFVLGVAHCGSTLLGRLLDMHSRILCVGELLRTDLALASGLPCGCGARVPECEFWRERLPWIQEAAGDDYRGFTPELFARIARSAGAEMAFDLSKTRAWRLTRRWKDPGVGYVLLVRDSRGVLASAARANKDLRHVLTKHVKWMKRLQRLAEKHSDRSLVVHYEDLCTSPESELRRVCGFLGLDFEAPMLRPADQPHHFVHSSASGYLRASNEIRLDERWRNELSAENLARIEKAMESLRVFDGRVQAAER